MADSDATACAGCDETIRNPAWWTPNLDPGEYLESERGLVLGNYPHQPEAPLCAECSRELEALKERYATGASSVPTEEGANENPLTEFLDEIDIDAFRDADPTGMP